MHQITLVSVALLSAAVIWTSAEADTSVDVDGSTFTLVFRPRKFRKAQKYCRNVLGGNLAIVDNESQLAALSDAFKAAFNERGEKLTSIKMGARTGVRKNKLVNVDDYKPNGKRCVETSWWVKTGKRKNKKGKRKNKGKQTGDTLRMFSKKCGRKRYFMCETPLVGPPPPPPPPPEPEPVSPGTTQTFTALGKEYTVDFAEDYQSQFDAQEFCQENGKRLAEVRDQATLDAIGAGLLDLQERGDLTIGTIATAERSSSSLDAHIEVDDLNPAGWACASLADKGGTVKLLAMRCAVERGVLCESITAC